MRQVHRFREIFCNGKLPLPKAPVNNRMDRISANKVSKRSNLQHRFNNNDSENLEMVACCARLYISNAHCAEPRY